MVRGAAPYGTLQNWEQGTTNPTGVAVTLMRLLDKNPELIMNA